MFEKIKRDLEKYEGLSYLVDDIYLHKNEFKDLYKYGMVLLGPDSFIQGEALSIIDFFRQKRFDLVSVKFKVLNRTQVEHLFLPTSSCIKCGDLKWWMIQDSADQGMFCGVLFFCDDASEEVNCLNKLNMYKGRSNPLDNASGVVRYDFSAINVCLNLIHVPDTYGDFFKDTSPFYGIGELAEITRLKKNDCYMEENYEFQIKLHENVNKYSFEILLYKVKYYLICLITNKCNHELNSTYYQNQYNIIVNLATREEKNNYVKKNITKEMNMLNNAEDVLLTKLRNDYDKKNIGIILDDLNVLRLLKIFTYPLNYKQYNRDIFNELRVYGIRISDFEKLILNTSLIQWK